MVQHLREAGVYFLAAVVKNLDRTEVFQESFVFIASKLPLYNNLLVIVFEA